MAESFFDITLEFHAQMSFLCTATASTLSSLLTGSPILWYSALIIPGFSFSRKIVTKQRPGAVTVRVRPRKLP